MNTVSLRNRCNGLQGLEEAGREEKSVFSMPPDVKIEAIPDGKNLSQMLEGGEIDALVSARAPSTLKEENGNVTRLFKDYRQEETDYYMKCKIFPIMHTVVIRSDVYDRYPWVAQNLYKAFCLAKEIWYKNLVDAYRHSLPWLMSEIQVTRQLMGEDFWPYGLEKNRKEIATFIEYSAEQRLIGKSMQAEDLFAKSTLSVYKV